MAALGYALGIWIVVLAMAVARYVSRPKYKKMTTEEIDNYMRALTRKSFISGMIK